MPVSTPVPVSVPVDGVVFAESIHAHDFRMSPRCDPFHKLLHVQRGRVELHLQNGRKMGSAGTVFIVPAGCEHRIVDLSPSVLLLVCLGRDWINRDGMGQLWHQLAEVRALEFSRSSATTWERLWRHALLEQEHRRPGAQVLQAALTMELLVMLLRHPTREPQHSSEEQVRQVTREMGETFFDPWTIDRAARRAGLSRRHFTQCFRKLNQQTLVNHLNNLRLDHVERLLRSGRHTVTGAVFSSGFEDLAHFYRLFRKRHGQPPGRWLHG